MRALVLLGVASLGLFFIVTPELVAFFPFELWLASLALLMLWIGVAAASGFRRLRPRWLVALTGLVVVLPPLIDLLPANRCLILGTCVF